MASSEWAQQKRQREREWKIKESIKRDALRPLRNAVNLAMRHAGIPHEHTHYSSRVKGWPTLIEAGYETESDTYDNTVTLRIWHGDHMADDEYKTMLDKAKQVLDEQFEYQIDKTNKSLFIITGMKS